MSDIMRPIGFGRLVTWILSEYRTEGSVFGVKKIVHYKEGNAAPIFEEKIESVFGPAAGPNSQLTQNIVASYLAGARFFELKTVQKMDGEELSACVNKPCIVAEDECYNCEWSTELTVPQAFDEYVKAWFICKLLAREWDLGDPDAFVFNMSVGYDLEGIKTDKIDTYIEGMKDASGTPIWQECMEWTLAHLNLFEKVDEAYVKAITPVVSRSITESTLHGCPPDEIERIATYLLKEKGLNTYIKCNPTLLGYDFARKRLDALGFDYIAFDDHHFVEDLQWEDAVPMLQRLIALGKELGLEFGVKLTNTFPVDVKAGELPSEEMYMSGRALYVLTIEVARRIAKEFAGSLRISYSGGADFFNIESLYDAGIWPVTMATTVLKPGGYERFSQIATLFHERSLSAFGCVDVAAVEALSADAEENAYYKKPVKPLPSRKMNKQVPLIDCFSAPCSDGCPIHQDIPAYLHAMEEGDAQEALRIILERNALPFITGTICPHTCGDKCMRNHYEEALRIRDVKLQAAEGAYEKTLSILQESRTLLRDSVRTCETGQESSTTADEVSVECRTRADKRVAIVGGGPAGLSVASFLGRAGIPVTIFERAEALGGVVRQVIPEFRIATDSIEKDVALCTAYGAEVKCGVSVTDPKALLHEGFTDVVIAVGAWEKGDARLQYGEAMNAIAFLAWCKETDNGANPGASELKVEYGKDIVVIGGGNTAMDVARAAKRLPGVEHVRLVYRRDRRNMPADEEELVEALHDGVEFMELLAPVGIKDGVLECAVMELGPRDESGRRSPVDTGQKTTVPASLLITAVGERVDTALYEAAGVALNDHHLPVLDEHLQTTVPHIYAAGDCKAGPATVVKAIADAQKVSARIAGVTFDAMTSKNIVSDATTVKERHGVLAKACTPGCCDCECSEGTRCLGCPTVCEACVEVCPNRANVAITVPEMRERQILHIDGMCNECGNCAVFCPYESKPYKDKLTLFWSEEDMENSENEGFLIQPDGTVKKRIKDETDAVKKLVETVKVDYAYLYR